MSRFDYRTRSQQGLTRQRCVVFRGSAVKPILAALATAGALAVVAPGSALAAPGSEGPSNCTFAKGTTICEHTTVEESSYTSEPDADGCITTTWESAVFTSYTAHRGRHNSAGAMVEPPPPAAISGTAISVECPTA